MFLPPANPHARNQEGIYWRGFETRFSEVYDKAEEVTPERARVVVWNISSENASEAAVRQKLFFKALDQYDKDLQNTCPKESIKKDVNPYDATLQTAISKLSHTYVRSTTVVMEAAFFLLQAGVLNIPDTGKINVKQARAFLWNVI